MTTARAVLGRWIYLALHEVAGIPVARTHRDIGRDCARLSPEQVSRARMGALLRHCQLRVPYYRALLPGQPVHDDESLEVLGSLPTLTREQLHDAADALLSDDFERRRWYYNYTGGSTGVPARVVQDSGHSAYIAATIWRFHESLGRSPGERVVFLWGSEREILEGTAGIKAKVLRALADEHMVNSFQLTPEAMRTFIADVERAPPKLIVAYAQSIYDVARFAEDSDIAISPQRAIITSAGTLYEQMRDTIERVFRCRVFNQYGSREVGPVALECGAHDGLHVAPWGSYVEVLDADGVSAPPGREGQLIVTCLTNYSMPLLRYDIGDRGVIAPGQRCSCGWAGTRLAALTGRSVDTFRSVDGDLIDGEYFTHLLFHREWIAKFQVVQRDYSHLVFRIVKRGAAPPEEELEIAEGARAVLGGDCRVEFEWTDELLPGSSGKYRYTVSEVARDAGRPPHGTS
jgi:phenylacetate-CoA ligase